MIYHSKKIKTVWPSHMCMKDDRIPEKDTLEKIQKGGDQGEDTEPDR